MCRFNDSAGMVSPDGSNGIIATEILAGPRFTDRRDPILPEVIRVPAPFQRRGFSAPTIRRELQCNGRRGPEFPIGSNLTFHTASMDPALAILDSRVHVGPRPFSRLILWEVRISRGMPRKTGRGWSGRRRCGLPLPVEAICDKSPATPELRSAAL